MICSAEITKLQAELANRQAPRPVSETAIAEVAELFRSCGYREDLNPALFGTLCHLGASEVEKTTGRGLFLKGDLGIGKSMGLEILAKQFGWVFLDALEIEGFYASQPNYETWEEFCRGCDFFGRPRTMVIDDLGTEKFPFMLYGTPGNPLRELLEFRYRQSFRRDGVRTIVTTNLTDEEIAERYGYRLRDRIDEMFSVVTIHGPSARSRKRLEAADRP